MKIADHENSRMLSVVDMPCENFLCQNGGTCKQTSTPTHVSARLFTQEYIVKQIKVRRNLFRKGEPKDNRC